MPMPPPSLEPETRAGMSVPAIRAGMIFSVSMNNHRESNHNADQEGTLSFAYALRAHAGGYDPVAAQRFGRETCQPLLALSTDADSRLPSPLVTVGDPGAVITSIRPARSGKGLMLRLFNVADGLVRPRLRWATSAGSVVFADPMEGALGPYDEDFELDRFEIVTLQRWR